MTAKTTDFSGLLFYNPSTNGFNPVVSASLFADNTSVNEGGQLNFTVVTWNVPDGTTLYYRIVGLSNMNYNQFTDVNDSVVITNNRGYFSVAILENQLTAAGPQTFDIIIEKTFGGGGQLAVIAGITVNDTSQDAGPLTLGTSLGFNGTDNRRVIVADNLADWNLGDNWTIEWWQKIPVGASGFLSVLCQDANVPTYSGIDVFINAGNIQMFNGGRQTSESAATRGQWNHIALQKNGTDLTAYINGAPQTFNGSHSGTIAPSSPMNVCIGSRTYDGGVNFYGQYFNGELANIRISSVARYTTTFTPPVTVEVDANVKLALDGSNAGGDGMLIDETTRHTLTNNGAVVKIIGATGNKVISLNPNYIALQGGNNIPNEVDSGSSAAALSAPFTGTLAQNGTLNFTGQNSALLLPAKNIKTIGMWIKITVPMAGTMYLVDSRVINGSGEGTGYFYSAGFEGWTLMSINGAPSDTSTWATIINNTNNWQYVTIINQTNTPHSITLFNRYTLGEGLYNLQVGWVEAWDYTLNDTQINTAYLVHRTDYTITTPNALQITVGSVSQGGTTPNNTVALSGVPGGQWTAIRNASSYVGKHGDNTTFSMTYLGDDNSGTFTFGVGTESSFQADSFWYVP